MFSIVFYTRSFTQVLKTPFAWDVESYEWNIMWGPTMATISADVIDADFEASRLLRCPVEILNKDGLPVWWGYVYSVNTPVNKMNVGVSLENMFNKVKTIYNDPPVDTGFTQAADSVAEYGEKEHVELMSETTAAAATSRRDRILNEYKYPSVMIEPYAVGKTRLSLRGWGDSLSWMYVTQASTTLIDTTTQISNVVSTYGQFLNGTHIGSAASITTSPEQDGTKTALEVIEELVKSGISGGSRMKAIVNSRRYLRLDSVSTPDSPQLRMRDNGKLETFSNELVDEERLEFVIGKWATLKRASVTIGDFALIHPFLIEAATWRKGQGAYYRPVGQSDALSLMTGSL